MTTRPLTEAEFDAEVAQHESFCDGLDRGQYLKQRSPCRHCRLIATVRELRKALELTSDTEDPGRCLDCGAAFHLVRPGKSQPTCTCWQTCPAHGENAIQYHPEGVVPQMSGYFCLKCEQESDVLDGKP